jgi:hypothetical protein
MSFIREVEAPLLEGTRQKKIPGGFINKYGNKNYRSKSCHRKKNGREDNRR